MFTQWWSLDNILIFPLKKKQVNILKYRRQMKGKFFRVIINLYFIFGCIGEKKKEKRGTEKTIKKERESEKKSDKWYDKVWERSEEK